MAREKIEDFGEKIGGARKDLFEKKGSLTAADTKEWTDIEKEKYIAKKYIWEKPDYQKLVDDGLSVRCAYFIKSIYDSLPAKPNSNEYKYLYDNLENDYRDIYIHTINFIKDMCADIKTDEDIKNFESKLKNDFVYADGRRSYPNKYDTAGCYNTKLENAIFHWDILYRIDRKIEAAKFLFSEEKKILSDYYIIKYDGNNIHYEDNNTRRSPRLCIKFSGGVFYYNNPDEELKNPDNWEKDTYIVISSKPYKILGRNIESEDKAKELVFAHNKENSTDKSKSRKKALKPPQLEHIERTGENYRKERNITGNDMLETFGFKGGEFGNWETQSDRQENLNMSFDTLKDLAAALNISDKDISLGGQLSIAYGARGISKAAAHFEPDRNVINLTKMKGAGSLAHEWGHALDYFTAREYGLRSTYATESYRSCMMDIMAVIKYGENGRYTNYHKNAKKIDNTYSKTDKGYWSSDVELFARAFSCYVMDKLSPNKSDYICGHSEMSTLDSNGEILLTYPTGEERKRINAEFDKLIENLKERNAFHNREEIIEEKEQESEEEITTSTEAEITEETKVTEETEMYTDTETEETAENEKSDVEMAAYKPITTPTEESKEKEMIELTQEEKIKNTRELYDSSLSEITSSPAAWTDFLKSSVNYYKHNFSDQLLIVKQNPTATAVAQFDDWENKMNRQIKAGATGIPVLRKKADGTDNITFMYDVADTEKKSEKSKEPYIWQMSEEYKAETASRLAEKYKLANSDNLEKILDTLSSNYVSEYAKDKENFPTMFVAESVKYAVFSRCGADTASLGTHLFSDIEKQNKDNFSDIIGNSVNKICNSVLRSVEVEVKAISAEREKAVEENTHKLPTQENEKSNDETINKINVLISQINSLYNGLSDKDKEKLPDMSNLFPSKSAETQTKETKAENTQNGIIGNTPYKYIPEKTYRKLDKDIALKVAEQIEKAGFKYSGKINGDTVTLTVSKKDIEQIDKMIADVKGTTKEQPTGQRHFTEEEIETAKRTNIVDFLLYRGEQLKKVGNDEYTMPQHDSMRISSQKGYYWNSRNVGGNALNFCIDYYGMDFKTAVTELLNFNGRSIENMQNTISMPQEKPKAEHKPLPYDISEDTSKVFEYLTKTRILDEYIVKSLIENGSIAQDVKGNAVYKIFDENGKLSGAEISGTSGERYKQFTEQNGGGFTVQPNKDKEPSKLMFFESVVDLLSFYSFAKKNNKNIDDFRLISMGGLKDKVIETAIARYEDKNGVKPSFFISVDNDEAGHKFNQKYPKNVYDITTTSIFKKLGDSKIKDWNELLQAVTDKEKTQSISYLPDDSVEYSKFIFDEGIRDKNLRLIYKNSADTYMMNYFTKDDITKAKNTAKTGNEFFKLLIDSSVKNEVEEGTFYYMGADNAYGRDKHIFSGLNAETMKGLIDFADNGILNIPEKETNNSGEIPSKEEMTKYLLWLGSNKRMSKRNILEGFSHLDTIEEKAEFIKREYTIKGLNDKSEKMKFSIGDKKYEWTWAELAASAEKMIAEHNYLTNKDIEKLGLITVDEVKEITKKAEDVKKYIAEINKAVTNEKSYIPLYTNSAEYARENGEIDDYRASNRENERCNKYITENYGAYHNYNTHIFDRNGLMDKIVSEFGLERATAVIAGYINDYDGRYTKACKKEAKKYILPKQYYTTMHPVLINALFEGIIDLNREKTKEMPQEHTPTEQTIDNSDKYKSLLTIDEEKAIEIFTKSNLPVYLIYDDNTNVIAQSEEEIENHSGTFGINKDDFEKYNSEAEKISETEDISDNTDVKEETKKEAKEEVNESEAKPKESITNEELINGIPKEIVLAALKTGTGFVDGKFRVEKIILGELDVKERIKKIKKEFGFGGRNGEFGNSSVKWISYDPTAYFIEWENANGKTKGKLSWSEVEKNLNQLVRNNQYVTPEERLKYEKKNYVNTKISYLKDGDRISVNGDTFTFLYNDNMGGIFVSPDNPNSPLLNSRPNGEYFINAFMLHRYDFEVVNGDIPKSADKNISYGSNNYKFFRGESENDLKLMYKKDNDHIVTIQLSKEDIKTVNDISNGDNRYFFNLLLNYGNKETAEKGNLFYTIAENDYNNNLPLFESFTDEIKDILVKFSETGEIVLPEKNTTNAESKSEEISKIINLYRYGDFYEAFGNEAESAGKILDLHIVKRNNESMVGFPQHALNMYVVPLEKAGYTVNVYEHRRDTDERTVKATSKEENNSNKKISPDDIKLGDIFLYKGQEVTVTSMLGIYPDDIGISKKEKLSNGMEYEITENVDKYRLASEGKYLGNIDDPKIEETKEEKSENKSEETSEKKMPTAEELKVGDVVKLPPVLLTDRSGKPKEFPSEYGVVTENDGKMVSFRTFSDETLTEPNGITSNSVSSLNENGFEYIKQISEIPSLFANKEDISIEEQEYNADIKEKVSQQDEDLLTNLQKEFDYNTSMFLIAAYENSRMYGWKEDSIKGNRIKRAFYEVLDSTPLVEKAFEIFKDTIPDSQVNYINAEQSSEITTDIFEKEKAKTFFVNGGGILTIPLKTSDKLLERLADAGLKADKNSTYQVLFETDNGNWNKLIIPDRWGNKTNNIDIDSIMTKSEIETARKIAESIMPVGKKDKAENFRITDDKLGEWTPKNKYKYNVEAIKTLKQIEKEDRQATAEEQEILSKYVGWGGLPEVFDERKENWSKEFTELKELLIDDEYVAARSSTLNAHYTTPLVINSIYKALDNMEFKGGKVLEPAVGVGNFFGMLPEKLQNDTKLYGVELDSITGRIAKQLYPNANIQVKGFEKTTFKNDFFDVAVGNVPFGNYRVHDENFKSNDLIHDYFIKKSLEKVKPNGVIAFVTSKGTMDKQDNSVRKYIAERADLLGAIRLPQTAFQKNAGTEVTTDILFLQKRENVRDFSVEEMPDWVNISEDKNGIAVNNYFIENSSMILGEMQLVSGQFGMESACIPFENADLEKQLDEAVSNIKGFIPPPVIETAEETKETKDTQLEDVDPNNYRNFCYCVINDDIYFRENDVLDKCSFDKVKTERIKGMIGISEALRELMAYQLDNCPDDMIKSAQQKLNERYDTFIAKYGLLSDKDNHSIFKKDDTSELLAALEKVNDKGKYIGKADIFSKRTIVPYTPVEKVDTASEALAVSISEKACVDLEYMSKLCSKPTEEIIEDLKGVIFENPETSQYETADEYLSGNVRKKLEVARNYAENDDKYSINVSSLEAVQPVDLKPSEISAQLCSTWIPTKYFEQFMYELLDTPRKSRSDYAFRDKNDPFASGRNGNSSTIMISYDEATSTYGISNKSNYQADRYNIKANQTYGTKRANAYKIIESTLNMQPILINDYVEDETGKKKPVLNKKETMLAQEKQRIIKQRFKEWVFDDYDRAADLCKIYNERFNSVRPREYDGKHITFGGMNPEITLREHQRNAIAHALYGKNTLFAHSVGAGKTYEICATAMESKRLGLCNKSLIVVPKHIVNQFAKEFLQLYPTANILVPDEKDFSKANREKFCSRIATGNYDAIIISHTQLERIPLSQERQAKYIEKQISQITKSLDDMKRDNGDNGFSIKQLAAMAKNLQTKLDKLNNDEKRDTTVTFEELGIDKLFVDEAHLYKNCAKRFRIR